MEVEKMKNGKIDTIIFDLGGVLVTEGHRRTMYQKHGLDFGDREYAAWQKYKVGEWTERQYFESAAKGTDLEGKEDELAMQFRELHGKAPAADAIEFLPKLKDLGYQMAMLSNHSTEWARLIVENLDLEQYFDPILISAEIALAKPDPAIYDYTLKAVDREPHQCAFIDDRIVNIEAARAKGIHSFHYESAEKLERELKEYGILR